jgi:hypothetical protein
MTLFFHAINLHLIQGFCIGVKVGKKRPELILPEASAFRKYAENFG